MYAISADTCKAARVNRFLAYGHLPTLHLFATINPPPSVRVPELVIRGGCLGIFFGDSSNNLSYSGSSNFCGAGAIALVKHPTEASEDLEASRYLK